MKKMYTHTKGILAAFFLLSSIVAPNLNAQQNEWTWMKGVANTAQYGIYGTQGTAANANNPGSRNGAAVWRDSSGMLWLFGGVGLATSGGISRMNDLWRYNPSTNQWTWIKGVNTSNPLGTYGTQGTPATANNPGGRADAVTWVDASGMFWLFGGLGFGASGAQNSLNDLWRYNPSTNQWTWMKGSNSTNQTGTYGTQGTAATANNPGGRYACASYLDASGNFWVFGGLGYGASTFGRLSDLWKYNPSSNEWTWMKGTSSENQTGTYGTQGTAASGNNPGGREQIQFWTAADGDFYLLGGNGFSASGAANPLNDLWKYSTSSNNWTWVLGTDTINQTGIYGTQGTAAGSNAPGSRFGGATWVDAFGNLWLLGGNGYSATTNGYLNDLWRYSTSTGQWTWMKGSNASGATSTNGTQGTSAAANTPGGRFDAAAWTDALGNLWFFGGFGLGSTSTDRNNDLWRFKYHVCNATASIASTTNVTCFGANTGSMTASSTNTVGSASYLWNSGSTSITATSLTAGTYTVTVTDALSCTATASGSVTQPATAVSASISGSTNVLCFGASTGSATATASGGTGSISYGWNNGSTTTTASSLTAGTYTVTATDASGCTGTATVLIAQPASAVSASITASTNVLCHGNNTGAATASGSGGTGSLTYTWSNSGSTATISSLTAATYTVTVTDASGCTGTTTVAITQPTAPLSISFAITNVLCNGGGSGAITATASGGTGTITYLWSNSATTATITTLAANTYTITVTDANGCTLVDSAEVTQPSSAVNATISSSTNVICFGQSNGTATASGSGGTGSMSYAWSGGGTSATKTGMAAGTYTVTVTDANGCTDIANVTITQPNAAVSVNVINITHVSCRFGSNGKGTASGAGGTGSKTYVWSNGVTTALNNNLPIGTYTVTATDQNGCTATNSFTITQPATSVSVAVTGSTNIVCYGGATGAASALGSGGVGSFFYVWSNASIGASLSGVAAGTYTVSASDQNSCTATASLVITQPDPFLSNAIVADESCEGENDGEIDANVSGGTSPYGYLWSNAQTSAVATGLSPGTYSVTVSDVNGCTTTGGGVVDAGSIPPVPDLGPNVTVTGQDVTLDPGVFDGYEWQDGSNLPTFIVTETGTYSVTVTDSNGCTGTDQITVTIWPTGVGEIGQGSIQLYPNPTQGQVDVVSNSVFKGDVQIELFDVRGQRVSVNSVQINERTLRLNMESLAKGTYHLRLSDANSQGSFSIVLI